MVSKEINVQQWDKIAKRLPKDHPNKELFNHIFEANKLLSIDNNNYVYTCEIEYGNYIIENGSMFHINEYEILNNRFGKTKEDFINDIGYSHDPLGLVLTNYIDVFTENKSFGESNSDWYNIPLNIINPGDFFGVFGYLDSIIGDDIESKIVRDWFAIAGNISFEIAFPFHHGGTEDWVGNYYQLSARNKGNDISHYNQKIEFIKYFLSNRTTEIIYFPKHFFIEIPEKLRLLIENKLYKIGWEQSVNIREGIFQDTTIYDFIREQSSKKSENKDLRSLKHDGKFLALLINYLINATKGRAIVLKPVEVNSNTFIIELMDSFKKELKLYFEDPICFEPVPFIMDKLHNNNEWGIVSFFHLPMIHQYTIISPTVLLRDINKIFIAMKKHFDKFEIMEVSSIAKIAGFYGAKSVDINTKNKNDFISIDCQGKGSVQYMNNNEYIKHQICKSRKGLQMRKVNLNSRLFANLFFINSHYESEE